MAKKIQQLPEVAARSESINDALALARQRARAAAAAYGNHDAATTETHLSPTPEDDRSLHALREHWRSLQMEGLAIRWQIGASCNEQLGRPTTGQNCPMTLKDVVNEIGCSLPDIQLMRWFARQIPDLNDFLDKHPAVTSWGKAKEIVAQLSPNRVTRKRTAFGKLISLIRKLTSQQQDGNLAFEQKEVTKLSSVLLRFTMALENSSKPTDASVEENE